MRAVRHHEYGEAALLRYEQAPAPVAGPGQVLLRVAGTAFNPVDTAIRAGYLRSAFPLRFPHVPGLDMSGTVLELGEGVADLQVGDDVVGFLPMDQDGAAAELALAPADVLAAAPSSLPLHEAAALPSSALSAYQSLFELADLQPGARILITGAGGAVGGYAVQLATAAGAHVIALASPRSMDAVRRHGAAEVVDRTATPVAEAVREPVDVVLNLAPLPDPSGLLSVVAPGGVLVTSVPPAPDAGDSGVRTVALFVRSDPKQLALLVEQVDAGRLTVDVAETLPLRDLPSVHARSEAGELHGKVVLRPESEQE